MKKTNNCYSQSEKSLIPGHPLQLNEIGSAVYPKLFQIVSHSCDPNCIKIFRGNQVFHLMQICFSTDSCFF